MHLSRVGWLLARSVSRLLLQFLLNLSSCMKMLLYYYRKHLCVWVSAYKQLQKPPHTFVDWIAIKGFIISVKLKEEEVEREATGKVIRAQLPQTAVVYVHMVHRFVLYKFQASRCRCVYSAFLLRVVDCRSSRREMVCSRIVFKLPLLSSALALLHIYKYYICVCTCLT